MKEKKVWVVWQNTDRTEGKGGLRNLATCESRETAIRLGKGQDVMGSDCNITEETAYKLEFSERRGKVYDCLVPGVIQVASPEDKKKQTLREEKEAALEKARSVLTEEEIAALLRR